MDEEGRSRDRAGRRSKRFLTPMQKYEIYLQVIRGEVAGAAGRRATSVRVHVRKRYASLNPLVSGSPENGPIRHCQPLR